MTPQDVAHLRGLLGMTEVEFSRFLGVSSKSVYRWERGGSRPSGTTKVVMDAVVDVIQNEDQDCASRVVALLKRGGESGGLHYVLVRLLEMVGKP